MEDSEIHDVDDLEMRNSSAPVRHHFLREHHLYQTYGHRQRTCRTWPKYSAKRLLDVVDLQGGIKRLGPQSDQPNHVIDDPHQIAICDNSEDDEPNDVLDLLDAEQELHQAEVLDEFCRRTDDPFVKSWLVRILIR